MCWSFYAFSKMRHPDEICFWDNITINWQQCSARQWANLNERTSYTLTMAKMKEQVCWTEPNTVQYWELHNFRGHNSYKLVMHVEWTEINQVENINKIQGLNSAQQILLYNKTVLTKIILYKRDQKFRMAPPTKVVLAKWGDETLKWQVFFLFFSFIIIT